MPQSLSRVWLHIVFSTRDRQPFLEDKPFRESVFGMLSAAVEDIKCTPKWAGGWVDHVHVVCGLSRTVTIAQLVEQLKIETSKWAKKPPHQVEAFTWQRGYGAFSVSESNLEAVVNYAKQQEVHHQRHTFQDEFRQLCFKHGIDIDERYVWD